jgi:hypothetical protein
MSYNCPTCCKPLNRNARAIIDYEKILLVLYRKYNDRNAANVLNEHNPALLAAELASQLGDKNHGGEPKKPTGRPRRGLRGEEPKLGVGER